MVDKWQELDMLIVTKSVKTKHICKINTCLEKGSFLGV